MKIATVTEKSDSKQRHVMSFLNNMNLRVKPVSVIALVVLLILICVYSFGFPIYSLRTTNVSMKELLCASIDVAKRGGDVVRNVREHSPQGLDAKSKGLTKEGAKQLYTEGDMASHRVMTYGMRKAFPQLTVISEEKSKKAVSMDKVVEAMKTAAAVESVIGKDMLVPLSDVAVWVDPLDATQEYTENLVQYVTTMVCVAVKGVPVIGVIHSPFKQETVWAWVGHGHSPNIKTPIPTPETKAKAGTKPTRVIVSRSHAGNVSVIAREEIGADSVVIPAGGAGYKSLALVNDLADVYVHTTIIKKWDICAGDAILRQLGGHMTDLKGHNIDYSASGDPKNEHGLLAALRNHEFYLQKFQVPPTNVHAHR